MQLYSNTKYTLLWIVRCNEGRIGRVCECSKDDVRAEDLDANCRMDNGTDICSNNGDCICGTCECKKRDNPEERYEGKYCECDNFNCDRSNNKLCGGKIACSKCLFVSRKHNYNYALTTFMQLNHSIAQTGSSAMQKKTSIPIQVKSFNTVL